MKKNAFIFTVFLLVFSSCSLKYSDTVIVDEVVPEFVFENLSMTRTENNKVTVEMTAEQLEKYKNSSQTFGKNVSFKSYDDEGQISTEGKCGFIQADTDAELYVLYDDINLFNYSENTGFSADYLKWNSKTEQLTGEQNDLVQIKKDDTVMSGTGFSASGISKSFKFTGQVSGEIETK